MENQGMEEEEREGAAARHRDHGSIRDSHKRKREAKPTPAKMSRKEAERGLANLGNSCYMNAVLQCLYHTPTLTHALLVDYRKDSGHYGPITVAYQHLVEVMHSGHDTTAALRSLKKEAGEKDDQFEGVEQQEAHDFLSLLLDWLHDDLKVHEWWKQGGGLRKTEKEEKKKLIGAEEESSVVSDLFYGFHSATIICPLRGVLICENSEHFSNVTLPVNDVSTSLESLLKNFYRQQSLVWSCGTCGRDHDCDQKTCVKAAPKLLLLHLSRNEGVYPTTNKVKVTYPLQNLSLQDHTCPKVNSPKYELYALVCHEGTMTNGHYTAYCRTDNTTESWTKFNDTIVSEVTAEKVQDHRNAHILFYRNMNENKSEGLMR